MLDDDFAHRIYDGCHLVGTFRLRSGQVSEEYFDKYLFESDPTLLRDVVEVMVDLLPDCDMLAGVEMGGIPIATAMSQTTGLPVVFVRKQAKSYGTEKAVEGLDVTGRRVVVVEDAVTTAGAVVQACGELRAAGAIVTAAVCAIDRGDTGAANLAAIGVELRRALDRPTLDAVGARAAGTTGPTPDGAAGGAERPASPGRGAPARGAAHSPTAPATTGSVPTAGDVAPDVGGFAARVARARAASGPLVAGLDPSGSLLEAWGLGDTPGGLERFVDIAVSALAGAVGFVKPQTAFYERHGWEGIRALQRLIGACRSAGLIVIVDAKRGDVGSTNQAYAQAFLGPDAPLAGDALTVHPYLGIGAMDALVDRAQRHGAGLFVVARSSNPEGRPIQTATTADGRSVEAALLAEIATLNDRLAPGRIGPVGAVVSPTHEGGALDLEGAHGLYLAPGLGAQGATVAAVARCFAACPDRVLPSASRSVLEHGPDRDRLRAAAGELNDRLAAALDRA